MITLDQQMIARYAECTRAHPQSNTVVPAPTMPAMVCQSNFERLMRGELVHVMVQRGKCLVVTWIPETPELRYLFDAYGR